MVIREDNSRNKSGRILYVVKILINKRIALLSLARAKGIKGGGSLQRGTVKNILWFYYRITFAFFSSHSYAAFHT